MNCFRCQKPVQGARKTKMRHLCTDCVRASLAALLDGQVTEIVRKVN